MKILNCILTLAVLFLLVTVVHAQTTCGKCKITVDATYYGDTMKCENNTQGTIEAKVDGVGGGSVSGEGSMSAVCLLSYESVPSHDVCQSDGAGSNDYCDFDGGDPRTQHNYTGGQCVYDGGFFGLGKHYDCKDLSDETSEVEHASGDACPVDDE